MSCCFRSMFPKLPLMENVPVRLLDMMNPTLPDTLITGNVQNQTMAVATKGGITTIRIQSSCMLMVYGFLRKVFDIFERFKTPIDMITTSEVAVSLTIDNSENILEISKELKEF